MNVYWIKTSLLTVMLASSLLLPACSDSNKTANNTSVQSVDKSNKMVDVDDNDDEYVYVDHEVADDGSDEFVYNETLDGDDENFYADDQTVDDGSDEFVSTDADDIKEQETIASN